MHHRTGRACAAVATAAAIAAGAIAGCGGEDDSSYANRPRPPALMIVTASISNEGVSVSPRRFGAGPIDLLVTNQTSAAQRVTLESAGAGAGLRQQSPPINPRDTARLSATVRPGRYSVEVSGADIRAASLLVGRQRASAQNELLQP